MKLPEAITSLFSKKDKEETYLSLYLDIHSVAAAFWRMGTKGAVTTVASAHLPVKEDTWEARTDAVDRLLGALEQKTSAADVTTTILGLPPSLLTPTGEIKKDIRSDVKALAEELELTLAGFVPLHQAIIFKLKMDEGVPPSVILLGVNAKTIAISLYKIGALVGVRDIEKHEDVALAVEQGLKSFTEMEVLPARILLYGSDEQLLDSAKAKLMHHSWNTKANFLHFPKIEIATHEMIVDAISLAGASEMKSGIGEELEEDIVATEVAAAEEVIKEDFAVQDDTASDDNVKVVDASSLGFAQDKDVLDENEVVEEEEKQEKKEDVREKIMAFVDPIVARVKGIKMKGIGVFVVIALVVLFVFGLYWMVPHAVVTVLEIPKTIESAQSVTIDPASTAVDAEGHSIPGRKREQTASGEKTVPVNGKKNVGDPAHGTVTIYNKSLGSRTFKKGTVVTAGSLKFTLDAETLVASASESIGSITFGKVDAAVTAAAIGPQSNLPANSEFSIADTGTSVASARNDAAFAGGTSREVVVVTRVDVDNFVTAISKELTEKAKADLSSAVTGGEQLIDGTIKTTVTEKVFEQEIDQEATALSGKVTIAVSGIAYSQEDIRALFLSELTKDVPDGYIIDAANLSVTVKDAQVKKDGTIVAAINIHAVALPQIDLTILPQALAGKSMTDAQEYLKAISGVGGIEVDFRLSPTKSRLPINKKNISVSVAISQ